MKIRMHARDAWLSRRRSAPQYRCSRDNLMPIVVLELSGTGTTPGRALASSPIDAVQ